jgi:hypothetical protein
MSDHRYWPAAAIILMTVFCLPDAVAATSNANRQKCADIQRRVLGYWKLRSGDPGLFDAMEFRADPGDTPRFNSWLHMRPDTLNAIWGAHKCHIDITTAWRDGEETNMGKPSDDTKCMPTIADVWLGPWLQW